MKVEKFKDKIDEKFAEKTRSTVDGIPLIGFEKTTELEKSFEEGLRKLFWKEKGQEFNPEPSHLSEMTQHYARIGAFLATINPQGKPIYEIGCGIAIPSLIYSLLTGNKIIACDRDEESIESTKKLRDKFGAESLELLCADAQDFMETRARKEGITLILNPPKDCDVVESGKFYRSCTDELIIGGYYSILPKIRDRVAIYIGLGSPLTQKRVNTWIEEINPEKHFESFGYKKAMIATAESDIDMWVLHLER